MTGKIISLAKFRAKKLGLSKLQNSQKSRELLRVLQKQSQPRLQRLSESAKNPSLSESNLVSLDDATQKIRYWLVATGCRDPRINLKINTQFLQRLGAPSDIRMRIGQTENKSAYLEFFDNNSVPSEKECTAISENELRESVQESIRGWYLLLVNSSEGIQATLAVNSGLRGFIFLKREIYAINRPFSLATGLDTLEENFVLG